jgi:hypothetical protein
MITISKKTITGRVSAPKKITFRFANPQNRKVKVQIADSKMAKSFQFRQIGTKTRNGVQELKMDLVFTPPMPIEYQTTIQILELETGKLLEEIPIEAKSVTDVDIPSKNFIFFVFVCVTLIYFLTFLFIYPGIGNRYAPRLLYFYSIIVLLFLSLFL